VADDTHVLNDEHCTAVNLKAGSDVDKLDQKQNYVSVLGRVPDQKGNLTDDLLF
jgi:hypothetical protein